MPYCPACHLERLDEAPICPLDGRYYRIERCTRCGGELAPADAFCVFCGVRADTRAEETVSLPRAPLFRRFLSCGVDVLCMLYVAKALPLGFGFGLVGEWSGWLLLAPISLVWFTLGTWGGRRTIGEHVLGVAVLTEARRGTG